MSHRQGQNYWQWVGVSRGPLPYPLGVSRGPLPYPLGVARGTTVPTRGGKRPTTVPTRGPLPYPLGVARGPLPSSIPGQDYLDPQPSSSCPVHLPPSLPVHLHSTHHHLALHPPPHPDHQIAINPHINRPTCAHTAVQLHNHTPLTPHSHRTHTALTPYS